MKLLKQNGALLTGALTKYCQRSEQVLKSKTAKIITKKSAFETSQKNKQIENVEREKEIY